MTILRIACLLVFAFAVSGLAIAADEGKSMPKDVPDFDVHGISMTECQCTAYACPCRSNGHPDHGSCDAADFTYIKHGHYGKVDMSGFKEIRDRKSTRLNSSHVAISYAVFCLKKKNAEHVNTCASVTSCNILHR